MKKKKLFTLPKLSEGKAWFVYYSYRSPYSRKMERQPIYEGFAGLVSEEDKRKHAADLIATWTDKLIKGYDPFASKDGQAVYMAEPDSIGAQLWAVLSAKKKIRPNSRKSYTNAINYFIQWLVSERRIGDSILNIKEDDANDYLDWLEGEKKFSPTTRNNHRGFMGIIFSGICKKYRKQKILYENPFHFTAKIPEERQGQTPFSLKQADRLRKYIVGRDPELWLACLFVRYTMVRTTMELPFLKLGDIDRDNALLTVRGEISKNRKTQKVFLHPDILKMMDSLGYFKFPAANYIFSAGRRPGVAPYSNNTLTNRFTDARKILGFTDDYSMYSFKHTGNAELHEKRLPLPKIRDQNRHSDLRTTDIYSKRFGFYDEKSVWA